MKRLYADRLGREVKIGAEETTHIAGEVLDSATSAANTARETGAEWVKGVSPTAAEVLRPGARKKTKKRAARQPRKTAAGKAAAGAARTANKAAKSAGKAAANATRAISRTVKQAARGAQKATRPTRKGGAKKR